MSSAPASPGAGERPKMGVEALFQELLRGRDEDEWKGYAPPRAACRLQRAVSPAMAIPPRGWKIVKDDGAWPYSSRMLDACDPVRQVYNPSVVEELEEAEARQLLKACIRYMHATRMQGNQVGHWLHSIQSQLQAADSQFYTNSIE